MEPDYSKFTAEDWKNYKPEEFKSEGEEKVGKQAAILEIRAGQGGDEAGLFARDLYKMYSRYGQTKGWRERVLDSNNTSVGADVPNCDSTVLYTLYVSDINLEFPFSITFHLSDV